MSTSQRDYIFQRLTEVFSKKQKEIKAPSHNYLTIEEKYAELKNKTAKLLPLEKVHANGNSYADKWFEYRGQKVLDAQYSAEKEAYDRRHKRLRDSYDKLRDLVKLGSSSQDFLKILKDFEEFKE